MSFYLESTENLKEHQKLAKEAFKKFNIELCAENYAKLFKI